MKNSQKQAGFSLVEVTIALAIIAFALTALMAMLPLGLSSLHDSKRDTIDARITADLTSQLQSIDWSSPNTAINVTTYDILQQYNGALFYYDSYGTLISQQLNGEKLPNLTDAQKNQIVYTAVVFPFNNNYNYYGSAYGNAIQDVSTPAITGNVILPGSTQASSLGVLPLLKFAILITDIPNSTANSDSFKFTKFPKLKNIQHTRMYTIYINQSSGK